ncbi:hypothetical protein [Sphingobium sp. DC-2]|uniref:hypothetical protein n=1 Tax=Sphingobium sp. DC-2 TaxID=1303256 RepID=UPI000B0F4FE2|nr:hypothetical protein [Sphingobium sp. DC-2]
MSGQPVVVTTNGGIPVKPVEADAPTLTVATNGFGAPITITDDGTPFIVEGYEPEV